MAKKSEVKKIKGWHNISAGVLRIPEDMAVMGFLVIAVGVGIKTLAISGF